MLPSATFIPGRLGLSSRRSGRSVISGHALEFEKCADTINLINAQQVVVQGGYAAGFHDPYSPAIAHVNDRMVHRLAVSDPSLVLQAGLGVFRGLLEREVMTPIDCAQPKE